MIRRVMRNPRATEMARRARTMYAIVSAAWVTAMACWGAWLLFH